MRQSRCSRAGSNRVLRMGPCPSSTKRRGSSTQGETAALAAGSGRCCHLARNEEGLDLRHSKKVDPASASRNTNEPLVADVKPLYVYFFIFIHIFKCCLKRAERSERSDPADSTRTFRIRPRVLDKMRLFGGGGGAVYRIPVPSAGAGAWILWGLQ